MFRRRKFIDTSDSEYTCNNCTRFVSWDDNGNYDRCKSPSQGRDFIHGKDIQSDKPARLIRQGYGPWPCDYDPKTKTKLVVKAEQPKTLDVTSMIQAIAEFESSTARPSLIRISPELKNRLLQEYAYRPDTDTMNRFLGIPCEVDPNLHGMEWELVDGDGSLNSNIYQYMAYKVDYLAKYLSPDEPDKWEDMGMYGATCGVCGGNLVVVRPGKYDCPACSAIEAAGRYALEKLKEGGES